MKRLGYIQWVCPACTSENYNLPDDYICCGHCGKEYSEIPADPTDHHWKVNHEIVADE